MNQPPQAKVLASRDEGEQGRPTWRLHRGVKCQPRAGPPAPPRRPPEREALAVATTAPSSLPAHPRFSEPPCRHDPT